MNKLNQLNQPNYTFHPHLRSSDGTLAGCWTPINRFRRAALNFGAPMAVKRVWTTLAVALGLLVCLAGAETQAATLAYWRFEPGNLGADSSGNGNGLTITGVTGSADVATNAPGTGSAVFNGSAYA